jgi:outer membrane receptor protein involved in Fe transport
MWLILGTGFLGIASPQSGGGQTEIRGNDPVEIASPQSASGRVEGVIKNAHGVPVAEVIVTLAGPVTRSEMADSEGRYVIYGLVPGNYTLSIEHPGFVAVRQAGIVIKADAPTEVPITLVPAPQETVVVTASRQEADLQSAPAAVSVVTASTLSVIPASNIGDMLRSVPGLNVVQTSAREINLASRQASPNLTNSQIALIDGRSIYSDFFNVIFWDLIPVNSSDVKQIEVVRGPVGTVWGSNAATGAVNIITKVPREAPGLTFTLSGGGFSRDAGDTKGKGAGTMGSASVTFSHVINERWSFRTSTGYSYSDAYSRPVGKIPETTSPVDPTYKVGGAAFSDVSYTNPPTKQPKFDLRVDQEIGTTGRITYEGGYAASQGIIQTPIGPFRMEPGSYLSYGRVGYEKGRLRLSVFSNYLDGKAPNLLSKAADGNILRINFRTGTYDIAGSYARLVGNRHLFNFGGNFRYNTFDITVAPDAQNRHEVGAYFEDEIMLGKFHIPVGFRLDQIRNESKVLFSPRAAIVYRPLKQHAVRFSYNLAHRSPSAVDNYLDISIIGGYLPLGMLDPSYGDKQFPLVTRSLGNAKLTAETLRAFELGYTGTLPIRSNIGLAFYVNDSDHIIINLLDAEAMNAAGIQPFYTSANPPKGWPLSPLYFDLFARLGVYIPEQVKALNYGKVRNKGFEVSFDQPVKSTWSFFANYSYQALPESRSPLSDPFRYPPGSLPAPPRDRFNTGLTLSGKRFLGNLTLNYSNRAFWTDVRDSTFYGYSDSFRMVNCSFGVRWGGEGKVTTSLKAVNLLNNDIQQHIFGDILKRKIFGEVQFGF